MSLNGLFAWPGFKQVPVRIERRIRREKSTYTFCKRVSLFATSIVDFSATPLVAIFYLGLSIAGIAFATALYFVIMKIVDPEDGLIWIYIYSSFRFGWLGASSSRYLALSAYTCPKFTLRQRAARARSCVRCIHSVRTTLI